MKIDQYDESPVLRLTGRNNRPVYVDELRQLAAGDTISAEGLSAYGNDRLTVVYHTDNQLLAVIERNESDGLAERWTLRGAIAVQFARRKRS